MQEWLMLHLAPLFMPAVIGALVQALKVVLEKAGTMAQDSKVKPFIPILAALLGGVWSSIQGDPALQGIVAGLAATGIHQAVSQPVKGK